MVFPTWYEAWKYASGQYEVGEPNEAKEEAKDVKKVPTGKRRKAKTDVSDNERT